jgi:glutaredoxin
MEKKILLYTTHCPKCRILEKKLTDKGIEFEKIDDTAKMAERGIEEAPALELPSGIVLSYYQAVKYVNGR